MHRLVTLGGEIDHRESGMRKTNPRGFLEPYALAIRTSMTDHSRHLAESAMRVTAQMIWIVESSYPTHDDVRPFMRVHGRRHVSATQNNESVIYT